MGFRQVNIKLPLSYTDEELKQSIARLLKLKLFSYQIENKSLDARNKKNIHWQLRIGISSAEIKEGTKDLKEVIEPVYKKRNKKIVIVGSGPAGFFAAYFLQKSGFDTTIVERGAAVDKRDKGIQNFEKSGIFDPVCNYSFGEGGAGTFSDGKLTSRSKHISDERDYILSTYIAAGAPAEMAYLAYPHIGSDNLKVVVKELREDYIRSGGCILFETLLSDLSIKEGFVQEAITSKGVLQADYYIIAPGHSSYETYKMLINRGVPFRTKNFAIGSRAEHEQKIINQAQWGVEKLVGVKAAEYRLTSAGDGKIPVYTFCMCPGGKIVPSTSYQHSNIVNGMSYYMRDGRFANAACVAGIHPDQLAGKEVTPLESLQKLEQIEQSFYNYSGSYQAPTCSIKDFLSGRLSPITSETSYPLGVIAAPLWEMLPAVIIKALKEGMEIFKKKVKGYETGMLLGLESKTSSPIQVIRQPSGLCTGFSNLFLTGEGSGYTGGIISSAADGVKTAMNICKD